MIESFFGTLRDHPDQVNAAVAVLALFVSGLSFALTIASMYLQRQHNFKSMTPIADIPVSDYEDDIDVAIANSGIGPLLIDTLRVTDGRETKEDVFSWMPELPSGMFWDDFMGNLDGACIPPGEKLVLIKLTGDLSDRRFVQIRDRCRQVLSTLTVLVTYKDIYGHSMPREERELDWFKRNEESPASRPKRPATRRR